MRWLIAAVLVLAGVNGARAQLVDPTTGVMVNATSDPADFSKVAGGQPGNIGTELAAQAAAQAQQATAQAMAQTQAASDAMAQAQQTAQATQSSFRAAANRSPISVPLNSTAAKPVMSPSGGTFHVAPGGAVRVTMQEKNPNAKIYYTTDGSRPTLDSAVYAGPIQVSKSETIKVLATGKYANPSSVVTEKFKIKK